MKSSNTRFELILASASPRRLALLRGIGLSPAVLPTQVDESMLSGEAPEAYVLRLAESKCRSAAGKAGRSGKSALIIAADTAVVVKGRVLGKPADESEAAEMLRLLRGRAHDVMTGVFLLRSDDGRSTGGVESSRVHFREYDERAIRDYVASGEPLDKAGAYAIQGGGRSLAARVEGSWSNVVGLPLERLASWLEEIGLGSGLLSGQGGSPG